MGIIIGYVGRWVIWNVVGVAMEKDMVEQANLSMAGLGYILHG